MNVRKNFKFYSKISNLETVHAGLHQSKAKQNQITLSQDTGGYRSTMTYTDEEVLKRAHELKSSEQNPFESFWFTLLMLIVYPFYFIPYMWEIYIPSNNSSQGYSQTCSRWQNIAIWWCIAVLFLWFDSFTPKVSQEVALFTKTCSTNGA